MCLPVGSKVIATQAEPSAMRYRPDIDGLRAIAVVAVILYHAKLCFPGGFIGVDVFFVISGYLITALSVERLAKNRFDLGDFYVKRIRRLLPALSGVVLATLVLSLFFLLPVHLKELGNTLIALPLLLVNVYYWRAIKDGYFGDPPEIRPLLHTWSLGVEEQFYLVFPFALLIAWKLGGLRLVHRVTIGVFLASLALSAILTPYKSVASFFLLPTRTWEFLAGAGGALWFPLCKTSKRVNEVIGIVGSLALLCCLLFYNELISFPGVMALPPVAATLLLIKSQEVGPTSTLRFLSSQAFVHVGKISYSAYLWHWPVMAFSSYLFLFQSSTGKIGLIFASLLLGQLSWRFIEVPFREGSLLATGRRAWIFATVNAVTLIVLGTFLVLGDGLPNRWDAETLRMNAFESEPRGSMNGDIGKLDANQYSFLLWGDSHAAHLVPYLEKACLQRGLKARVLTSSATAPLLDWTRPKSKDRGTEWRAAWSERAFEEIRSKNIKAVVLAAAWYSYSPDKLDSQVLDTIGRLRKLDVDVFVVGDVPHYAQDVHRTLFIARLKGQEELTKSQAWLESEPDTFDITKLELDGRATLLDTKKLFRNDRGAGIVRAGGQILYRDSNHLTPKGAEFCAPAFTALFASLSDEGGTDSDRDI